jgi:hypothetical protein
MNWLERTAKLRRWTGNGIRAPHKPLLLLYVLSRLQEDADGELRYTAVEEDLKRLLAEYGPANKTTPAYPFHRLASDGVWEVRTDRGPGSPGSPGSGVRELRATGATGRLTPEPRAALRREPSLLGRMTRVPVGLEAAHVRWWAFGWPGRGRQRPVPVRAPPQAAPTGHPPHRRDPPVLAHQAGLPRHPTPCLCGLITSRRFAPCSRAPRGRPTADASCRR